MRIEIRILLALLVIVVMSCGHEKSTSIPGCPDQWPWNKGTLYRIVTASRDTFIACNVWVSNPTFGGESPCAKLWLRGGGTARVCETYTCTPINAEEP